MQVYYFTRTGRSRKIAEEIASKKNLVLFEIKDDQNWKGAVNFIRGGYYSSTKKTVNIDFVKPSDKVILVFPIWAGSFPPAVRTFIDEVGRNNIILVPTSMKSILSDKEGFINVFDVFGKDISAPAALLTTLP